MSDRPRIVIVGGGFGGLWAAKHLKRASVDVTLVDRHNYHTFFPLLYQVAAAELQPGDITHPIRAILRKHRATRFVLAEATDIDFESDTLHTTAGPLPYDHLILSPGSTTKWFGVAGAEHHAMPLRTLEEAITLRNHTLERVEASHHLDGADHSRALTFVVVGGGPTGVEFAGALQELIVGPLARDHHDLDIASTRIILVEGGDLLLPTFPERLSTYARRRLERMGVEVRTGETVVAVDENGIDLESGERIETSTVVWAAGVGGDPDLERWGFQTNRAGRVAVRPDLQVADHPNVWVVGDASLPSISAPMVAQNAIQQGRLTARNVLRVIAGQPTQPYEYRDLGTMAVIGRNAAVAHFGTRWRFTGYPAWLMWLGLHIIKLIGFRNRIAALMSWAGDYLFRDRVARLIIRSRDD